jgi:hypothetical protein
MIHDSLIILHDIFFVLKNIRLHGTTFKLNFSTNFKPLGYESGVMWCRGRKNRRKNVMLLSL